MSTGKKRKKGKENEGNQERNRGNTNPLWHLLIVSGKNDNGKDGSCKNPNLSDEIKKPEGWLFKNQKLLDEMEKKVQELKSEVENLNKKLKVANEVKTRQRDILKSFLESEPRLVCKLEQYNRQFRSFYPYIGITKRILEHLTVLAGMNTEEVCRENIDFIRNEREALLREWGKAEEGTVFHSFEVENRFDKWYPVLNEEDREIISNIPTDKIGVDVCRNVLRISGEFAKYYPDKKDPLAYKNAFEKIKPYILECKKWSMTGSIDASAMSKWATDMVEKFQFGSFPKLEWIFGDKAEDYMDYYEGEFDYPALYYCISSTSKTLVFNGAVRKTD